MDDTEAVQRTPFLYQMDENINNALHGTRYSVSDYSLFVQMEKSDRLISNFTVVPTEIINKDNGTTTDVFVKAVGLSSDGLFPEVTLPLREFERMDWITKEWGFSPCVEPMQNVNKHIWTATQKIGARHAQTTTVYTTTGWAATGSGWIYLHGGGAVGADNVMVELEQSLSRYSLPPSYDDNFDAIANSYILKQAAPSEVTIPLLALVYLPPLNEFLRLAGHEPSFITMLVGKTGTMKSTLAALVLNHFGEDFTGKSLPGSFKDTANALEAKGFILKDALNVIDDFHPATLRGEHDKMTAAMQSIIRSYGDRVGRGRLTSDARLRPANIPRGNLLVTGEDIPRVEESGLARLLILELEPEDVDIETISELQKNTWLLNQSMRGYIEWLIPQADSLPDTLGEKFLEYRQRASKKGLHQRIAETIAFLYLAYEMFLEYAIINGVIREKERQSELEEVWYILVELGDSQNKMIINDNPVTLFLTALDDLLATEKCYCVMVNGNAVHHSASLGKGSGFIGYMDSEYFYLRPETVKMAVQDYYRRQGVQFSITTQTLCKHLANEDLILVAVSGGRRHNTITKNISGENARYLHLKKSALAELNTPK